MARYPEFMKPHLIIFGKDSYLGSHLFSSTLLTSKFNIMGSARSSGLKMDLSDPTIPEELYRYFETSHPKYIVMTAAIPDVDWCAKEPIETRKVNVLGTKNVLDLAKKFGAIPIFFSSDYVLSAAQSLRLLTEEDECLPMTEYGKQKREVEVWISEHFEKYIIFRTSKLMSMTSHPKNILSQVTIPLRDGRSIQAFGDQWITPVFLEDVVKILGHKNLDSLSGTYHLSTRAPYSRFSLACFIKERLDIHNASQIISSSIKDLLTVEKRPQFNTLDSQKISSALNFDFTEIIDFKGFKNL